MLRRDSFNALLALFALALAIPAVADESKPTNQDGDRAEQGQPEDAAKERNAEEADDQEADDQEADDQEADDQEADDQEADDQTEDEAAGAAELAERWLNRMRNLGRRSPNERSHDSILAAFEEISAPASESTALVFSGETPKAIGAIVSRDGHILTKASELQDDFSCRLKDGRHLNAELIGVHKQHDLAMLKVEADDLKPIAWETESVPAIGSWLVTPGIEAEALAIGVVSVAPRRIRQTPGVLGVSVDDGDGGAKITGVMPRSAAKKAGVQKDDIVLSVNGKRTKNRVALVQQIRKYKPGDEVKLKIKRGDEELELTAALGTHFTAGPGARKNFQNSLGGSLSMRRAGFEEALQHDTVLKPHECGGPVLNLDGKAVGVNIARAGRVASYALPAKLVVAVVDDLKSGKLAVKEPSEKVERITELKREIQNMTSQVNEMAAEKAAAQKRLKQAEEVLKAAQASHEQAQQAAAAAREAVQQAEARLEKLQSELDKLEAE